MTLLTLAFLPFYLEFGVVKVSPVVSVATGDAVGTLGGS